MGWGTCETSSKNNTKRIVLIFDLAIEIQNKPRGILSEKEFTFLGKFLPTKNIPIPKLIIKDHKKQIKSVNICKDW